ncbi:MAG: DUF2281 domain-containing protein [Verrucomicrobia subdivision 3 bacterium]|nr:DUF2281 domain-containing protein [Gemmataceae bacterium]MCI0748753.1 DUF2281 domain-containing protein [Limisphaerales bacterium]
MTINGHIRNGVVVLDEATPLPDGTPVRVEVMDTAQEKVQQAARRQGGQFAGLIWMAPDFDEWPEDLQEAFGMKP